MVVMSDFIHPYRHELLQFYDHHAKLAAGYNRSMQTWRGTPPPEWPLRDDGYAPSTIALFMRKAAEHYEIADGARRLLMGEGINPIMEGVITHGAFADSLERRR
jgi:hypothetical protein